MQLAVDLDDQQMSLSHAYAQCKEIRRSVETIDGVDIADVHLETEDS